MGKREIDAGAAALAVSALLLGLVACTGEKLQATFLAENVLVSTRAWDNAVSLQPASSDSQETVRVLLHGGRAQGASDTDPNAPTQLHLSGVTRLQGVLTYKPEVVEFTGHSPGTFFEQAAPGRTVTYNITAEMSAGEPTGRLLLDISVPQSAGMVRKGDFVRLEFDAVDSGITLLQFEGGFGALERNGVPVTGVTYYGGQITVLESATQ